ncbi:MAG: threonine synthase, partial [Halioglobus sp.]
MKYISTRGQSPALGFEDVLLTGLAPDGGLFVPESLPSFSPDEIAAMADMDYVALAQTIIEPFVADAVPAGDLTDILRDTYAEFR